MLTAVKWCLSFKWPRTRQAAKIVLRDNRALIHDEPLRVGKNERYDILCQINRDG